MSDELFRLEYSLEAIEDSINISEFILLNFTQKEVRNFHKLIERFEKVVVAFPLMFPKSSLNSEIHRAVLSKPLSVFYAISGDVVLVIGMIDNRVDYPKWP
jgi:plasmid stabilization system protein ParE